MDSLNNQQKKAVTTLQGPVVVIAGAGTGKTRVLEYRTLELVKSGIDPKSILLLTFTRRAAAEMLARAGRLDKRCRDVSGGTFHSFALGVLQRYGRSVGIENFTVLDRADTEDLIGKVISDLRLKQKKYFPKKRTVTDILSKSVNKMQAVEIILENEYPHLYEWKDAIELVGINAAKYKRERNLLDFDDLLLIFAGLLGSQPQVRKKLTDRYQYIMVDEYQDTNKIQDKIVRELAKEHTNLLVVGDEMQSIYKFRGAEFTNMVRFPDRFKGAQEIPLETNYRSTQEILDIANNVLDQVEGEGFSKQLNSDRSGAHPEYRQFKSIQNEADFVAKQILDLSNEGYELKDIAVLFRAAYQSAPLEIALNSLKIPFKKYGGIRFIEAAHVKDVMGHLRFAYNPNDELSFRRCLLLIEGIGDKTADTIMVNYDSTMSNEENEKLQKYQNKHPALEELFNLIEMLKSGDLTPSEKLSEIISYYKPILRRIYDDYPQREQDLEALIEIALPYRDSESLLNDMALDPPDKSAFDMMSNDGDHVTLSTVHSAKGLEWRAVFIIQAQEGKFPIVRPESKPEDIEEERRLFYVAVTRAKERLYITSSHGRSRQFYESWFFTKPSRFVEPLMEAEIISTYLIEQPNPYFRPGRSSFDGGNLLEQDIDEF